MKRFHSHTFIVCMALGTKIISLFILTKISKQSNHLSAKPPCKKKQKTSLSYQDTVAYHNGLCI